MSTTPDPDGRRSLLLTIGVIALPLVCCGLPVLLAAGGLGVLGSILGNPWVIAAAALIAVSAIIWRVRARPDGGAADPCCGPAPLARNEHTDRPGSTSHSEER